MNERPKFEPGQEVQVNPNNGAEIALELRGLRATFFAYVETSDGSEVDCIVRFETPRGRRKLYCGWSADLMAVDTAPFQGDAYGN